MPAAVPPELPVDVPEVANSLLPVELDEVSFEKDETRKTYLASEA